MLLLSPICRTLLPILFLLPVGLNAGCALTNNRHTELLPTKSTYKTGPFVIHSHKPLRKNDPVVQELDSLTARVVAKIGHKPAESPPRTVDVYILADEQGFRHFLQYYHPELPPRRAYFIATAKNRSVYTYQGDHLMEDLRHEATHAIVNLTHPGLPLWLDEGLAEVFEHPDREKAPDTHQIRFLADIETGALPDLKQLESITDVRKMSPKNYREAWAWALWGLSGPKPVQQAFRSYMDDVARLGETESQVALKPLSERWAALPESAELAPSSSAMLAWLRQSPPAISVPGLVAADGKIDPALERTRLQNDNPERVGQQPTSSRTLNRHQKGGLFSRLRRSIFGD